MGKKLHITVLQFRDDDDDDDADDLRLLWPSTPKLLSLGGLQYIKICN